MKLLLSLDYEIFFGANTGTVERCLQAPIEALLDKVAANGVKLSLFVDAGYLLRLKELSGKFHSLQKNYDAIRNHLSILKNNGHDIQLHIHPHWVDSHFDGESWRIDSSRYRLHDFDEQGICEIVHTNKEILTDIAGDSVFAFRGGGWCIQPFDNIADALLSAGVWLESTVFHGGKSEDPTRWYDFLGAPDKDFWRFKDDPNSENDSGPFLEVPISSFTANPFLFWRMALAKKFGGEKFKPFGDGSTMTANSGYYISRLTSKTQSVTSIDGLKAGMLKEAYTQNTQKKDRKIFHIMGHPKSLSRYSISALKQFIDSHPFDFITFQDFKEERPLTEEQ